MRWESRLGLRLRAAARRLSARAFLEKFRHGPDTQSEWNLFLWRVSFPMIPLVLFTTLAVLGQCGHLVYSLLVCPVWYFSHLVLVAHPFLIVFRFENVDASASSSASSSELESSHAGSAAKSDPHGRRIWQALALLSLLLSVLEWVLSTPPNAAAASPSAWAQRQHHAWISANSLFGLAALVAVPHFFFRQKRRAARDAACQPQRGASGALYLLPPVSPSTPTSSALSATEDGKPNDPFASSGDETDDASSSPSTLLLEADLPPMTSAASTTSSAWHSPVALWRWLVAERSRLVQSPTRRLLLLCAFCASALWTAMVASYTSTRALEANLAYWFAVYLLSPLACGLLWVALRQTEAWTATGAARSRASTFSFEHVVTYSVLVVHLPACLGHLCFRLFTLVELSDPAHSNDAAVGPGFHASAGSGLASAAASTATALSLSATTSWMKLATSMLFLLVMQGYFHVMTRVVNAMSEPYAHPSLLYLGQLYYYLFWYVLVGSDTPIDMLYWGQLLINYVHIALLNTGIYSDVKASSTSCCASVPSPLWGLLSDSNASVLMCFRATMLKSSADHEHASGEEEEDGDEDEDLERAAHELLIRSSNNSINDDDDDNGGGGVQHRPSQRRSASVAVPTTDADAFLLGTDEEDDDKTLKKKRKKRRNHQRTTQDERRHRSLSMIAASARALLPFSGASAAAAAAASSSAATIYFAPAAACVSNCASGGPNNNSACSLCRTASTGAPCAAVDHHTHHRVRHHSSDSTDSATPPASQSSASYRAKSHRTSSRLHQHKAAPSEHMRQLYFLMKLAEQDNMADTTALILVPSLLTLLAVLDKPTQGLAILLDQMNLWLRCICMFIGRLGGAYLAREIFTYKLRRRLRQQQADRRGAFSEELLHNIGGLSTRLWIQKLMLQDFHRQFWYLTMVTVVVTFACFERMELPARFAFLN